MPLPLLAAARRAARLADPDAALVARFARDADPAAFAELIARHGPAVWGVCRRAARTSADAEDVFQATFLVLARDAGRVRRAAAVGSWLFGVAVRLGRAHRRRARTPDPDRLTRPPAVDPAAVAAQAEFRAALDEEIATLPDALRAPLLLCYYDGLTQDEAAAALGWPPRAVKAKVARGRAVLRARLTRRGVELPTALAVPLLASPTPAPARVTDPLPLAAAAVARGRMPEGVSATATALARSGTTVLAPAVRLTALGVVLAVGATLGVQDRPPVAPPPTPVVPRAVADDPLPPGAVARMGTSRYRVTGQYPRVFFTPNPDTLAVTSNFSDRVRFMDAATGRIVGELALPGGTIREAAASTAGDRLAVVGTYRRDRPGAKEHPAVWVIDAAARKVLWRGDLPENKRADTWWVRVSADGARVATAVDDDVRVWDVRDREELAPTAGGGRPEVFDLSPDGSTVALGLRDVRLWRWETEDAPRPFARNLDLGIRPHARFTPDGRSVLIYEPAVNILCTWDVATKQKTATRPFTRFAVALAFRPDGKELAVADAADRVSPPVECTIELIDPATGRELGRLPMGHEQASGLCWSADGRRLAAVTWHRVRVWDAAARRPLGAAPPGHDANIFDQAFAADGTLFTASGDHTVHSWDAAGRPELVLRAGGEVRGLALAPDGGLVAGFDLTGTVRVWDAKTGAERWAAAHGDRLGGTRRVAFTADGTRVLTWADDLTLRVTDARTGKQLAAHPNDPDRPAEPKWDDLQRRAVIAETGAFSRDGSAFAYVTKLGVQVLDPLTGAGRRELATGDTRVERVVFAPDGRRLAVARRAKVHVHEVNGMVPPGGIVTEDTHAVEVWDIAAGTKVWTATAEGHAPRQVVFSPDGAWVIETVDVTSTPTAARIWDAATGRPAGRLVFPARPLVVAFDRTGRRVAVGLEDTTAVVFDTGAVHARP